MSVSMYQTHVGRLLEDIARLQKKQADEAARAAKERGDAVRIHGTISKSTSSSMLTSKLKDIQRREAAAAEHDKKAARHAEEIARKQRSLSSSQASLNRALEQQRKKTREEDLRHLNDLEAKRRSLQTQNAVPFRVIPSTPPGLSYATESANSYKYDVCLSFAGEERSYVEMVAAGLKKHGVAVFYDADKTVDLWGKDLAAHLDTIYRKESRYCVMFISEAYARKAWTRHERRSALARAIEAESEYILPARFDDTDLEGLPPTVAYLDLRELIFENLPPLLSSPFSWRSFNARIRQLFSDSRGLEIRTQGESPD